MLLDVGATIRFAGASPYVIAFGTVKVAEERLLFERTTVKVYVKLREL